MKYLLITLLLVFSLGLEAKPKIRNHGKTKCWRVSSYCPGSGKTSKYLPLWGTSSCRTYKVLPIQKKTYKRLKRSRA